MSENLNAALEALAATAPLLADLVWLELSEDSGPRDVQIEQMSEELSDLREALAARSAMIAALSEEVRHGQWAVQMLTRQLAEANRQNAVLSDRLAECEAGRGAAEDACAALAASYERR